MFRVGDIVRCKSECYANGTLLKIGESLRISEVTEKKLTFERGCWVDIYNFNSFFEGLKDTRRRKLTEIKNNIEDGE